MKITHIQAREILDSRGNPTVEVEVSDGTNVAKAAVPSGASTGVHEALELRDGDSERYHGKGVLMACENVNNQISPAIIGMDPVDQKSLDQTMLELDGTENKSNLGANAILGVSLAACRLAAVQKNIPLWQHIQELYQPEMVSLPRPMMNIINGGAHADSGLAIQEFMIFPKVGAFAENLRAGSEIFQTLKKILQKRGEATGVGDEGGFAPHLPRVEDALWVIMEAIEKTGYRAGDQIEIALDSAASEFAVESGYEIDGEVLSPLQLVDFYQDLVKKFPIVSIEDSHAEDDINGFKLMSARFGKQIQMVGDDLFVTNKNRLQMGIDGGFANAILIKVNQIGSLSETFETMKLAEANGYKCVISHRSGETEDAFIADLAVGTNAGQIKTGSLSRSERTAKYNQLLRIAEQIS